ncbi:MAG: hypothetical protein MZV49_13340 [Rhodopseudomonas palustris]|nr:hypothetical protein [Rhodopseudomonas palustris]
MIVVAGSEIIGVDIDTGVILFRERFGIHGKRLVKLGNDFGVVPDNNNNFILLSGNNHFVIQYVLVPKGEGKIISSSAKRVLKENGETDLYQSIVNIRNKVAFQEDNGMVTLVPIHVE